MKLTPARVFLTVITLAVILSPGGVIGGQNILPDAVPPNGIATGKAFAKILVLKKGFLSPHDAAVQAFAKEFGFLPVVEQETNPICCVWLEPLSVDKNLTRDQFVMVHYGYSVIQVTGADGLDLLRASLLQKGYGTNGLFPVGVFTSFPVTH